MRNWLFASLVLLTGCTSTTQKSEDKATLAPSSATEEFPQPAKDGTYSDSKNGFRIQFPVGWRTENRAAETVVAAISPLSGSQDEFTENIAISVERGVASKSTEEHIKEMMLSLIQSGSIVEPSSVGQIPTRSGLAAYLVGKRTGTSGEVKVLISVLVVDGNAWTIICSATPKTYGELFPIFQKSIKSFRARP